MLLPAPLRARGERWLAAVEDGLERERAQLPLWTPMMLGIGILAWFALPMLSQWLALICLCLAGATALLFVARGRGRAARMAGVALLLIAGGCVLPWGKALLVGGRTLARPAVVRMEARVERVETMGGRGIARLMLRPVERPDLPERVRVNVDLAAMPGGESAIRPGVLLRVRARLMPPAGPAFPGAYDYARRAWFDGIGATGRALPPIMVIGGTGAKPSIRERLTAHVAAQVPGAPGSLAVTLATGDRGAIPPEVEEAMRQSGLSHLLSISGVHVTALIGGVVLLVYRLLALSRRLTLRWPLLLIAAGAGAAAGIGYTLLTGAEVPTIRSCVTALLVMAGLALGREAISLRLLACGALLVMLLWPDAVIGPSFQLSFMAVAAIVTLYEHPRVRALFEARSEPVWAKGIRFLGALFITGIAVEGALMPIALYHFHRQGLLGSIANMIAIPLTEFVIMPAEALALILDTAGAGAPAWWVVEKALALLLLVAHVVAGQSAAVALTPAISPVAFAMAMTGLLWIMLWRSRMRWWGLLLLVLGLGGYALAPVPDVLVSSDGRHVALRTSDGGLAILRDRAGNYMRDQLAEQAAYAGDLQALTDLPDARCSLDLCTVDMTERGAMPAPSPNVAKPAGLPMPVQTNPGERRYRLLMTRTRLTLPWRELVAACADADIVIADRRLPRACRPRWLKLDRTDLSRSGGAAIDLSRGAVRRSRDPRDEHPWVTIPPRRSLPDSRRAVIRPQL